MTIIIYLQLIMVYLYVCTFETDDMISGAICIAFG